MKNRIVKWETLGLLVKTPEDRKVFVVNSFELLLAYLLNESNESNEVLDGRFETLILPIFCRIGNEVDFGINDFFSIINEVRTTMYDLENYDENEDAELLFCQKYSENKINELKNK